ncbi:MAG: hypothetical protein A2Y38_25280 [Spirochaetes bacterium GWB1_59_5]|nr:MAG: hypothetical protein A2Y38_25280 [Spirochaetes bacterium GWB1_59_5]
MPFNLQDFKKVPIAEATAVPSHSGQCHVTINKWWAVTEDDCILYFGISRQCNEHQKVIEHMLTHEGYPGVKAVFIPVVFDKE